MASEHTITHFPPLPQHSYNSPNLPGLLPISSQGSVGPTVLLSLLFPVKYGLSKVELLRVGEGMRGEWVGEGESRRGGRGGDENSFEVKS